MRHAMPTPGWRKPPGLALAIGIRVAHRLAVRLRAPKPATLIGSGQVEAIAETVRADDLQLAIFDAALTPVQQRNLETGAWVQGDRSHRPDPRNLRRTRTRPPKDGLQVELAHLDYQAGRLVRSWTHLERQRGGFGFLGGPGETQIEADRRLIRDRMARLRARTGSGQPHARPAPRAAAACAVAGDRAGRLYQRGQIDAVQPPDRCRRHGGKPVVRHARPDVAADFAAGHRQGDPVRHRRLRVRPADATGRGVQGDAGGSGVGRSADPRPRRRASRQRGAAHRCRRACWPTSAWTRTTPRIEAWNKLDLLDADARAELLGRGAAS